MSELEKMKRAHMYITQLAEGVNPLTGVELPEDTLLNQVRMSRCFYYVADVLRQVIDNGGEVTGRGKESRGPFRVTAEELRGIAVSEMPLTITRLCERISAASSTGGKLGFTIVTEWLTAKGFMRTELLGGKRRRRVTPQGERLGLAEEIRNGPHGDYLAIVYSPEAQQFVIDNLPQMLADKAKEHEQPKA